MVNSPLFHRVLCIPSGDRQISKLAPTQGMSRLSRRFASLVSGPQEDVKGWTPVVKVDGSTPKRCIFVRGHDESTPTGVAIAIDPETRWYTSKG